MNKLLSDIRKELKKNIDLDYKKGVKRFFKEEIKVHGVRTPVVREISKKYFQKVKHLKKKEIFLLCEKLLQTGYGEQEGIAFNWAFRLYKQYERKDFKIFESWLKEYVSDWAKCDIFCSRAFGYFIYGFPEFLSEVRLWTKSKNRWLRRASAVILIYPIKRSKKFLSHVFKTADILLMDFDDMVQKGYGWMLKETSNIYPKQVFDYVMKNKDKMPRTALRYAIEKYPQGLKKKAMER
ncbi:MAG: DNA alkylation repair protein [Candidatus Nealsonbacteria bacterium]